MKKLLFVFYLFIFLLGSISNVSAESWYYVNSYSNGSKVYIDNDAVAKSNAMAIVDIKSILQNGSIILHTISFNRIENTFAIISITNIDLYGVRTTTEGTNRFVIKNKDHIDKMANQQMGQNITRLVKGGFSFEQAKTYAQEARDIYINEQYEQNTEKEYMYFPINTGSVMYDVFHLIW